MSYARDRAIANEAGGGLERSLTCGAAGCPNRWSVDAGSGRLCSAHAWVDRKQWPQITQEQQDAETDRALDHATERFQPQAAPLSREEKRAILTKLRCIGQPEHPKAWAEALRVREESGERLTQAQRAMWRAAIGREQDQGAEA